MFFLLSLSRIAVILWFTGELDCMDETDEVSQLSEDCFGTPLAFECDERVDLVHSWSCGDGQTTFTWSRLPFQTVVELDTECSNKRNLNHMCETSKMANAWTLPNGMCEFEQNYDDPRYNMTTVQIRSNEGCVYLLKCALTKGFERDCPCGRNTSCYNLMVSICPDPYWIQYPRAGLIRPYLLTYYTVQKTYLDKTPSHFLFSGRIKCRGFLVETINGMNITLYREDLVYFVTSFGKDIFFCADPNFNRHTTSPVSFIHSDCWNDSKTFSNLSYYFIDACYVTKECISAYRINDGVSDCPGAQEELKPLNSCSRVRRHRFQCSHTEPKCLIPYALVDNDDDCSNKFDRYVYGNGTLVRDIPCRHRKDDGCRFLKAYIEESSVNTTTNQEKIQPLAHIRHQAYCDSHWDSYPPMDEFSDYCKEWLCKKGLFQCKTHQCIPLDWVCDGEWDCSDASDELNIFLPDNTFHNDHQTLHRLQQRIRNCSMTSAIQPFADRCNFSTEFPCLLANVTNPLDIKMNRPCIDLKLIGNSIDDCYGGLDERNTAAGCQGSMIGFDFRCGHGSTRCISSVVLCISRCSDGEDDVLCFYKSKNDSCRGLSDVVCFNGECKVNARCNGSIECQHGEDEYWCPPQRIDARVYRSNKHNDRKALQHTFECPSFPDEDSNASSVAYEQNFLVDTFAGGHSRHEAHNATFICNRGLSVALGKNIKCMCSGAYYGNTCQHFSDRITVLTHLNLTYTLYDQQESRTTSLKVIAFLVFEDHEVIDTYEFSVIPALERINYKKHKFYLVYSRSDPWLQAKQRRHFNRTDIIERHPYSVRFEAFELQHNRLVEVGTWNYPIYFDYLPTFRLAIVLRFPETYMNHSSNPCVNSTCNSNSTCIPLLSSRNGYYYCSCKSGFYGNNCQLLDENCPKYCSIYSVCRRTSRSLLLGTKQPLCICPLNRFGPRCYLRYEACQSDPCQNDGTCYHTFDLSGMRPFMCKCPKHFYGDMCEKQPASSRIQIAAVLSANATLASVVQYYDLNNVTMTLILRYQKAFFRIPTQLRFDHAQTQVPVLGVLKQYSSLANANYYVLYIQPNKITINITSPLQHCPHAFSLVKHGKIVNIIVTSDFHSYYFRWHTSSFQIPSNLSQCFTAFLFLRLSLPVYMRD